MKRYEVTEKHPVYKKGLIIIYEGGENDYILRDSNWPENEMWQYVEPNEIQVALKEGWIVEIN